MARFWIGGSGNINDIAHWAATSGGTGGETVPDSTQDVFIDDNSGSPLAIARNAAITIASIDVSGRTSSMSFSSNQAINVEGNATLSSVISGGGTAQLITFKTNSGVTSIFTAGGFIEGSNFTISLDAADAIVKLGSNFTVNAQLVFSVANGTFDTDGYTLKAGTISATAGETVYFRNSIIQLNASSQAGLTLNAATNFDAGTSTIQVLNAGCIMTLGGHTLYRVELLGGTAANGTEFQDQGYTIDYLYVEPGAGVEFEKSVNPSYITTLEVDGTLASPVIFSYTSTGGAGTYALCVTNSLISYLDVQYMNASCGNPVVNPTGTDSGNNTNILFAQWWEGIPGAHYAKPKIDDVNVPIGQLKGIDTLKPQASIVNERRPLIA